MWASVHVHNATIDYRAQATEITQEGNGIVVLAAGIILCELTFYSTGTIRDTVLTSYIDMYSVK